LEKLKDNMFLNEKEHG